MLYQRVGKLKSLIISSPILQDNKLITTNALPNPTVSDHHAPYIITNRPGIKFQTRTKYIRNINHFHIKDDAVDFKTLLLGLVYGFVLAHHSPTNEIYPKCRDIRNKLKSKNQRKKTAFYKKISSKNCKEIWKVVHRVLKPNDNTLNADTNKPKKYFNNTAARLVSRKSMSKKN